MIKSKKDLKENLLMIFIIICGLIFHLIAGNFPKRIDNLPDELRYYSIARDICFHRNLYVRGVEDGFQKILYSLAIAPLFTIGNQALRIRTINFLNSLIMGSSAIPLVLIAKELKLKKEYICIILIIFSLWPESLITMTFMAETLYWPLVFWFIYLWLKDQQNGKIFTTILSSIVCYLGYMDKEIFLAFFLAFVLIELYEIVCSHNEITVLKAHILKAAVFISVFVLFHIVLKCTIFKGLDNSYASQIGIKEVLDLKIIAYILYAIFYYFISCVVVLMIAPVSYLVIFRKHIDGLADKLLKMLVLTLIIAIIAIAYTISAREDLFSLCPRLHIRYLAPMLVSLLLIFVLACQNTDKKTIKELDNRFMLITVVLFVAALIVFRGAMNGSTVDYFSFKWYLELTRTAGNKFLLSIIILVIILTITFMIWAKSVQKGKSILLVSGLIITILVSDFITCRDLRTAYSITEDTEKEMLEMSDFCNRTINDNDNILYFCKGVESGILDVLIDTYIDNEVIFTDASELEDEKEQYTLELREPISQIMYDGIGSIDYIILNCKFDSAIFPDDLEIIYQNEMYKVFKTNIQFN